MFFFFFDMNNDNKTQRFLDTLLKTNRTYDYFICWKNIVLEKYKIEICAINSLIGIKDDVQFKSTFYDLLLKTPSVICLFPFLCSLAKAERTVLLEKNLSLEIIKDLQHIQETDEIYFSEDHLPKSSDDIQKYYNFFDKMGLKHLYQNLLETSTHDYIIGTLVGLDTNGRKNRGGEIFEQICEPLIEKACSKLKLTLLTQKKLTVLKEHGCTVPKGLGNKKADFIVINELTHKAMNIEVNFYNGTGSKPEEIIDSYITRSNLFIESGNSFTLITDGYYCWNDAKNQIERGFQNIQNLINYSFLAENVLEEILKKELFE